MTLDANVNGDTRRIRLGLNGGSVSYTWGADAGTLDVRMVEPGIYTVLHQGRSVTVTLGANGRIEANGEIFEVEITDPRNAATGRSNTARSGQIKIAAPMPGRIVRVLVAPGDTVEAGQGLIVVEAMKMQNEMKAPRDARVAAVRAVEGATVAAGEVLLLLE